MAGNSEEKKDLYQTLGVARDADTDTIRKAYKKLARKYHPDLNPGDRSAEDRFKQISRAWNVLEDAEKRRNYDEFGDVSLESGFDAEKARRAREAFGSRFGYGGQAPTGGFGEDFHFGDIDDLLGRVFRGGGAGGAEGRGMRLRGSDVEASLELDFVEAVRGGEKRLTLARPTPDGAVANETVTVRIPPGVDNGGRLRVPGKGMSGLGGGPDGDLWVDLRVRPHAIFRRDGRNLELDLPISVREAIRGARVEVPTLDGRVTLTVPPGTDSGVRLRLRGKGVPAARSGSAGDLFARIQIRVPKQLDDEAAEALDRLGAFEDPDIRKELFS
jgi:DnaJ-class molecular chaperone